MNYYILEHDAENYRWLECANGCKSFFERISEYVLTGKSINNFPKPITCRSIRDKKERIVGDFPVFSSVPAISEKAKNILYEHLKPYVEFYPIVTQKYGNYYIMNVLNILDCLDKEKSKIRYLPSGTIFCIDSHSFFPIEEKASMIFRIKDKIGGNVYINEITKNLIENSGLQGFKFIHIYSE